MVATGAALFCSGGAGLVNEVVWQRALKRFLGGSESVSSMIVVVVFMLGLGAGSVLMGRRAQRIRNPLRVFAIVEGLLALMSALVCLILRSDLTESIYQAQLVAVSLNVPLPLVFGLSAAVILLAPCLLMGATMPLATESFQRSLGFQDPRILGRLFFINTLGGVAGAITASFYLIPWLGFTLTMVLSVAMNTSAGLLLIGLAWRNRRAPLAGALVGMTADAGPLNPRGLQRFRRAEILLFGLGFCSLAYEMLLFRLFALEFEPLPYTFAFVLAAFLLFWSVGAGAVTGKMSLTTGQAIRRCAWWMTAPMLSLYPWLAVILGSVPGEFQTARYFVMGSLLVFALLSFVPCFWFGFLFAQVTSSVAKSWGRDVGRIYAWSTAGSCLGALLATLIGYELHIVVSLAALVIVLITLRAYWLGSQPSQRETKAPARPSWAYGLAALFVLLITGFSADLSPLLTGDGFRLFFSRGGVIGVDRDGNLIWDGLWHSKFSDGRDHIGTNNWRLATSPVLAHSSGPIRDACVIGLGTGITAATLAKLDSLESLDVYDINRGLADVLGQYPGGSLGVLTNPKVQVLWQDARAGLALGDKKYDIIVTQPLYLKQSGSGLLNSQQFLTVVRSRLKPGGVFCLYSQGSPAQQLSVRETAASVFTYGESLYEGYLLVLSQQPLRVDRKSMEQRFSASPRDPLWREIAGHTLTKDANAVLDQLDRPRLSWDAFGLVVTDDHPVIEYPGVLETMQQQRQLESSKVTAGPFTIGHSSR